MSDKEKILIADDSAMNRAILTEMLGDGYEILEAENGRQAVAILQSATDIDLLLLDIMMPEMDGFEVLAMMNKYHWIDEVPVIMISAENASSYVERAYDLGATDYISRPFDMAVAVAGSPTRGIEFLKSAERQDARRQMVRAIDSLIAADEADVLSRAKSLIVAVKAPLAEVKSTQEKVLEQNADYLSRGALKQLEDRNKRELNARERSGIMEALASARTLMRDVLLTLQDEAADVVNEDVRDTIGRLAAATNVAGATRALEAVATAERNIARNVTPQLAIEVMLFDIRKALKCR